MGHCLGRYGDDEAAWRKDVKAGDEVMVVVVSYPGYASIRLAVAKRVTATLVIVESSAVNKVELKYARDTGLLRGSTSSCHSQYIVIPTEERKVEAGRREAVYRLTHCKWDDLPVETVLRVARTLEEELTK